MTKIKVPTPKVSNVSVPEENVCETCSDNCCDVPVSRDPDDAENVIPERVPGDDVICRSDNHEKYRDCSEYNTVFCRQECVYGMKESSVEDVNLDYTREDGR